MKITIRDKRYYPHVNIFLAPNVNGLVEGLICVQAGQRSKAHVSVVLQSYEVDGLLEILNSIPIPRLVNFADGRLQISTYQTEELIGVKSNFISFIIYDNPQEYGHVKIEFSLETLLIDVNNSYIFNPSTEPDFAISPGIMELNLLLDEKNKGEYYYQGNIAINTHIFKMNKCILVDIESASDIKRVQQSSPVNFCPLGEMINITFSLRNHELYAEGSIGELEIPMAEYNFLAKILLKISTY